MHWPLLQQYRVDDRLLAFQATNARRGAALLHPFLGFRIRINQMELPQRTLGRIAGIAAPDARGIGRHGPDLLDDAGLIFPQADGVVIRFGHFLSIQPRHL